MTKGVLLFAFNSPKYNYYEMAVHTAKRVNHFLNLPVTIVTNTESITNDSYTFDKVILATANTNNKRDWGIWINKGRYQAYELSPYDSTILLDTDYMVNSDTLTKTFELPTDFCCHNKTSFLFYPNSEQEKLSPYGFETLWATVIRFDKTPRSQQVFETIKMIENNFQHYSLIHGFMSSTFRNDYALTLGLRIVNGHSEQLSDYIPWHLVHCSRNNPIYKNTEKEFNTEYTLMYDNWQRGKIRKEYITIKNTDFHVMNKDNFMELI